MIAENKKDKKTTPKTAAKARKKVDQEKVKTLLLGCEELLRNAMALKFQKEKKLVVPISEKKEEPKEVKEKIDYDIMLFSYFLFLLKTDAELKRHISSVERHGEDYISIKISSASFNLSDVISLLTHYGLKVVNQEEKGKSFILNLASAEQISVTNEHFLKIAESKAFTIPANVKLEIHVKGLKKDIHFDASIFSPDMLELEGKALNRAMLTKEIKEGIGALSTSGEAKILALSLLNLFDGKFSNKKSIYEFAFDLPGFEISESSNVFKHIESDPTVTLNEEHIARFVDDEVSKESLLSVFSAKNVNEMEKTFGRILSALYVISQNSNMKLRDGANWNEDDFHFVRFPKLKGPLIDFQVLSKNKDVVLSTEPVKDEDHIGEVKSVFSLKRIKQNGANLEKFGDVISSIDASDDNEELAKRILQILSVKYDEAESYEVRIFNAFQSLQNINTDFGNVIKHIKTGIDKEKGSLSLSDLDSYLKSIDKSDVSDEQKLEKLDSEIYNLLKKKPKDKHIILGGLSASKEKRTGIVTAMMAQALVDVFNETDSYQKILKELKGKLINLREIHMNVDHTTGFANFVLSSLSDDFSFEFDYAGTCSNVAKHNIKIKAISGI